MIVAENSFHVSLDSTAHFFPSLLIQVINFVQPFDSKIAPLLPHLSPPAAFSLRFSSLLEMATEALGSEGGVGGGVIGHSRM